MSDTRSARATTVYFPGVKNEAGKPIRALLCSPSRSPSLGGSWSTAIRETGVELVRRN